MANVVLHQTVHGLEGESGAISNMVEPQPVDDLRKDEPLKEGYPNSNESWCYWVPYPGVRDYCFRKRASTLGPVERSRRGLPT